MSNIVSVCWMSGYYAAINTWCCFSLRGVKWGALCLHCSEHRNVTETEGDTHLHSKGQSVETGKKMKQNKLIFLFLHRFVLVNSQWWVSLWSFILVIFPFQPDSTDFFFLLLLCINQSGYWSPGLVFVPPQNEDSSTHEKLDFKLHFTCTSYLITTPCYRSVVF